MSGSVDEMSLNDARREHASSQSCLQSFGSDSTTYVGIVRSDNEELVDAVDEVDKRLAPPDDLFYQWYNLKQQIEEDGLTSRQAHREAATTINYEHRFDQYLLQDTPQTALSEYTQRIESGERIVFVCFCPDDRFCHRHPVLSAVRRQLDND
jgi:hypothetical protein